MAWFSIIFGYSIFAQFDRRKEHAFQTQIHQANKFIIAEENRMSQRISINETLILARDTQQFQPS
jgi:hypothetical protein